MSPSIATSILRPIMHFLVTSKPTVDNSLSTKSIPENTQPRRPLRSCTVDIKKARDLIWACNAFFVSRHPIQVQHENLLFELSLPVYTHNEKAAPTNYL